MTPRQLLDTLAPSARQRFGSDRRWAAACNLPPETLSRLRKRGSCDLRTVAALAHAVGYAINVEPANPAQEKKTFSRETEEALLDLCASRDTELSTWRTQGDGFFMAGLATLLASLSGFNRARYLALAEELHPGITQPEVFALWLQRSPLRPARFVPMLRRLTKQ